jgi:hypothetical protein
MRLNRQALRLGAGSRLAAVAALLVGLMAVAGGAALARAQAITNVTAPTISGPAGVGGTLTGTNGTWTGQTGAITFTYQWLRCPPGGTCTAIPGETNNFRVVDSGDVGSTLVLRVTATDAVPQSASADSPPSATVVATPVNFAEPAVSGNPVVGSSLTATDGAWTGSPTSFTREWRRCPASGGAPDASDCSAISGATSTSYFVTSADVGSRLRFRVNASNAAGASTNTVASNATPVVSASGQQSGAPVNTVFPSVAGAAVVGQTMTATPGTWTGAAPITFAYQWLRCDNAGLNCVSIAGATTSSYVPSTTDVGSRLRVRVTGTNSSGSASAQSNASAVVSATGAGTGTGPPVNTAPPTISGTAESGETLSASRGTWTGATPMTFTYRWMRCTSAAATSCTTISGATDDQLELGNSDVGRRIRVEVTAENDDGEETALSTPTVVVAQAGTGGGGDEEQQPGRCTMSIPGAVALPGEAISIPSTSVSLPEQLVASGVRFAPNPVRSRSRQLRVTVLVEDTRGCVVRDALVFVRSVPLVTSSLTERPSGRNGTVSARLTLRESFPLKDNGRVQFFIRVRKPGDPVLTGVGRRRLVQVGTEAP